MKLSDDNLEILQTRRAAVAFYKVIVFKALSLLLFCRYQGTLFKVIRTLSFCLITIRCRELPALKWDEVGPPSIPSPLTSLNILVSQGKLAGLDKPDTAIPS